MATEQRTGGNTHKVIRVNGVVKRESHYIWFLNTGYWPDFENKQEIIHHLDGNLRNNSFENLQLMTKSEQDSFYRSGKNSLMWHGDSASAAAKYVRHWKYPEKYPPLTDAEREEYNAYNRKRRRGKK